MEGAYGWNNPPHWENPAVILSPKHRMRMGFGGSMVHSAQRVREVGMGSNYDKSMKWN